jgi:hypothetical protein
MLATCQRDLTLAPQLAEILQRTRERAREMPEKALEKVAMLRAAVNALTPDPSPTRSLPTGRGAPPPVPRWFGHTGDDVTNLPLSRAGVGMVPSQPRPTAPVT